MSTIHQQNVLVRTPYIPAINWGAIFAGVVVGLAVNLVLSLLGLATGLTVVGITEGGGIDNAPIYATAWHAVSMFIAAFIGGYVAARMSGLHRKNDGLLHGFVAWGATTLLFVVFATTAASSIFGSVFDNASRTVGAQAAASGASSPTSRIEALVKGGSTNSGSITAENMQQLQEYLSAGQREQAIGYMVQSMGFERERAETLVDQALILSGSPERASPEAQSRADATVEVASAASWGVFLAVALSLVLGLIGGLVGAAARRRDPSRSPPPPNPTV